MAAMISEAKIRRVVIALISGFTPRRIIEKINIGNVRAVGAGNEIRDLQIQCLDAMNNTNFF